MLVIRLQRTGRRNVPAFRLVVAEKSAPIKGGVTEYIGHYLPTRDPHEFECNKERIAHWISVGAKPTDTVARLLNQAGVEGMEKYMKRYTKQKKKKEAEEEPATEAPPAENAQAPPAEEAPAEPPAEEPKEEATEEEPPAETPKEEEAPADTEEKKE